MLDRDRRRNLGTYYTPENAARVLVRWALDGRTGYVLDPSFGGCSFLRQASEELHALGEPLPGRFVYGVDIDIDAWDHARELTNSGVPPENVRISDFFTLQPGDILPAGFDAVVGNPPYVRHHRFQDEARTRAVEAMAQAGIRLSARASAWAYFVVHAAAFVKPTGRLAFLLPGALLHAEYAAPVFRLLKDRFASVRIFKLAERLFDDAQEETLALLASGEGAGPRETEFTEVSTVSELAALLAKQSTQSGCGLPFPSDWKRTVISKAGQNLWARLQKHPLVKPLGALATVRLGVVTGANSFFVRPFLDAEKLSGPGVRLTPIIPSGHWLRAAKWTRVDQKALEASGYPTRLLFIDPDAKLSKALSVIVQSAEDDGLADRYKCSKRVPWYAVGDRRQPDAFLRYMGASPPHLTLNEAGTTCTNAIHRVYWRDRSVDGAAVAVASWCSLFSFSAEMLGRSYGGGVLKLEPGEAVRLPIPVVPAAARLATRVDKLARRGQTEEAIALADQVILMDGFGLNERDITTIRVATAELANRRIGKN